MAEATEAPWRQLDGSEPLAGIVQRRYRRRSTRLVHLTEKGEGDVVVQAGHEAPRHICSQLAGARRELIGERLG